MTHRSMSIFTWSALAAALLLACSSSSSSEPASGGVASDGGDAADATTTSRTTDGDAGATTSDASSTDDAALDDSGSSDASDEADSDVGSDAEVDASDVDAAPLAPTFTAVYASVLSQVCAECHGSASGMGVTGGHLLMDSKADAYTNLVGVAAQGESCGRSGETRVVAGSSSTSLLWQKVSGSETCGSRMPLNNAPLAQAQIDQIAAWINAGASND